MVHNSEDKTVHDFVFINGLYCEKGKALLPLSSRGFLYGDGLFETIRGYNGTIFAIDMHL
jgi:branched-chain amino acid aminotransferase